MLDYFETFTNTSGAVQPPGTKGMTKFVGEQWKEANGCCFEIVVLI